MKKNHFLMNQISRSKVFLLQLIVNLVPSRIIDHLKCDEIKLQLSLTLIPRDGSLTKDLIRTHTYFNDAITLDSSGYVVFANVNLETQTFF